MKPGVASAPLRSMTVVFGADVALNLLIRTERDDRVAARRQRLRLGPRVVDGDDLAAAQHEISGRCGALCQGSVGRDGPRGVKTYGERQPCPAARPVAISRVQRFIRQIVTAAAARQRLARDDQLRSIRAGARLELLHPAAEAVGAVEIALRVDRHLVQLPEGAGERAVGAPRIQQLAVRVVLEDLRVGAVGDPHVLVRVDHDVVRLAQTRPLIEELAAPVEDLNAMVGAVGDVDASAAIGGDAVRPAELAGTVAARAPRRHERAVLVELRDARVAEAVGDQEAAVRQPRDVLRPAEMLVVVAGDVGFAERAHQLLAVVGELVDLVPRVVHDPDVALGIVRADPDLVRSAAAFEQLVPLRPRFDHLAAAVDDDDAVAHLGLGLGGALVHRSPDAVEPAGQRLGQLQLTARGDEDPVRRFGEDSRLRSPDVARLRPRDRPVLDHRVGTGLLFAALLLRLSLETGGRGQQADGQDRRKGDGHRAHGRPYGMDAGD